MQTFIASVFVIFGLFMLVACGGVSEIPPIATAVSALPTPSHTVTPTATVSNPPTSTPTVSPTATPAYYSSPSFPIHSLISTPKASPTPIILPTAIGVIYSTPSTPEPSPTGAIFPVVDTAVTYVVGLTIAVGIYSGPDFDYNPVGDIVWAETIPVTGQSEDGQWWRVLCPDNRVGSCWVYADYTFPIDAPSLEAMLPDTATLNSANKITVPSPDGQWQATTNESENATVANRFDFFYTTLTVTDGTTSWIPIAMWQYNSTIRGIPVRPRIIGWSADGRYLYFTEFRNFEGCIYFNNASNLIRLDVTDGSRFGIVPENATVNLSMSPGAETLAYITPDQSQLMLRNMESDNVERISLTRSDSYAETSEILWSADGETAVFTLIHDWCYSDNTTHSSIMRIDADTLTVSPVIDNDPRLLRIQEWPDPTQNKVLVADNEGKFWLLDIDSGELTTP